ncbi:MAG: glycosyltransferase family 4 protein [Patescibacteria group bacterium]
MQEKKKILYIITKGNFGGAQRYVYDLTTNMSKTVFDIIVACGNKDGNSLSEKLAGQNIRTIVLENSEREINIKNDFRTFRELIKIIKSEKPDVIHLNSSKIGLLGSLAILYLKFFSIIHNTYPIPHSIFTAHGWAFNEKSRSAFSRFVFYLGHYLTILICDKTIAVSEKAKKDISFLPFIKDKIKVVYNGISEFEKLPKEESRIILASKASEKVIIFSISELHKNKGIDVALKALALLPKETQSKIIYCVASDGEEKTKLEKLAKELNIENMVRFLGFVPDAKKLLSGADIFLMPSRTEAFPYAILEAGMAGLAIIATSVGGIPEVIKDMQNGILVHPCNPKEIAEAILYLLNHPDKQKEFGSEIKKTISNFFSLEKMISETNHLYQ